MKRIIIGVVAGAWLVTGGCSTPPDMVLDSFEGPLTAQTVDYGAGGGALLEIGAETDSKVDGEQSLRLEYDVSGGGYLWAARGYKLGVPGAGCWSVLPGKIRWSRYKGFSLYMFGTNSGGQVAFDIKDHGAELWRFMLEDNFEGWREIVIPFDEFYPRSDWQPHNADQNSRIDFPIMSFQFEPHRPEQGTYYFDRIALVKK